MGSDGEWGGSDGEWGELRRRTVAWHDPQKPAAALAALSGIDAMTALRDGAIPPPPIAAVLDFRLVEVEVGRVVFEATPDEAAYNLIGVVHGGFVSTLADSAAGCAVHTTLPQGVAYTSIDFVVRYLRPVTADSGVLRVEGRVIKPGRRVAHADVDVLDGSGRLVATAASSCLVMDGRSG